MPAISTVVAAVGVAAGVAGTVMTYSAQKEGQSKLAAQQKEAENVRQTQMSLDAMRRKRDIIRQAQIAKAQSEAIANAQGAGESSGIEGATAGITNQGAVATLGVNQNKQLGDQMFDINRRMADTRMALSQSESMGAGLSSLGGALVRNAGTIGKVGNWLAA